MSACLLHFNANGQNPVCRLPNPAPYSRKGLLRFFRVWILVERRGLETLDGKPLKALTNILRLIGTTIMSVGAILQTAAYGYAQMMVGRIVAGIGNGINTVCQVPPYILVTLSVRY